MQNHHRLKLYLDVNTYFRIAKCYHAMSSRKGKESSASLDEVNELINSKFETLEVKLTAIENKSDAVQADLHIMQSEW